MSGQGGGEGARKGTSGGQHIDTMKPGLSSGEIGGVKNTKGRVDPEQTFKAEPLTRRDREGQPERDEQRLFDDEQE